MRKKITYEIGDRFKEHLSLREYLLAQVEANKVCLIGKDGNRWKDPVEVNDVMAITVKEFRKIKGTGEGIGSGKGKFLLIRRRNQLEEEMVEGFLTKVEVAYKDFSECVISSLLREVDITERRKILERIERRQNDMV
jgi:hypothetical protein